MRRVLLSSEASNEHYYRRLLALHRGPTEVASRVEPLESALRSVCVQMPVGVCVFVFPSGNGVCMVKSEPAVIQVCRINPSDRHAIRFAAAAK